MTQKDLAGAYLAKAKENAIYFKDGLYIAISFGVSYRIKFAYNEFHLFCNSVHISCYISLSDAKQAANEHYKKQIKKALGL